MFGEVLSRLSFGVFPGGVFLTLEVWYNMCDLVWRLRGCVVGCVFGFGWVLWSGLGSPGFDGCWGGALMVDHGVVT